MKDITNVYILQAESFKSHNHRQTNHTHGVGTLKVEGYLPLCQNADSTKTWVKNPKLTSAPEVIVTGGFPWSGDAGTGINWTANVKFTAKSSTDTSQNSFTGSTASAGAGTDQNPINTGSRGGDETRPVNATLTVWRRTA